MVLAPSGTFDYVAVVPDRAGGTAFECRARTREPIVSTGHPVHDACLVGVTPVLQITDAGLTPDANAQTPRVMRSRITLATAGEPQALVASVWFHVDQALTSCLRAGDLIHLVRTPCAGIGLSVVRHETLVVAVGAITEVPLGQGVEARNPDDLIDRAETIFRERDGEFEFRETPIEIRVGGSRVVLYEGRRTLEDYGIFVLHGFRRDDDPGTDAYAAIYRRGACPESAAQTSAMLLDLPDAMSIARR